MRIQSNFSDLYDAWADRTGPVLRRMGNEGFSKPAQFQMLGEAGYRTPEHGRFADVYHTRPRPHCYVVYDDIWAHTGDGKRLISNTSFPKDSIVGEGAREYYARADWFVSAFVGPGGNSVPGNKATSWRHLQIGRYVVWLEYTSEADWRSNVGDGTCEVIGFEEAGYHPYFRWPLFAIDFVPANELYAIDLNNAPGMRGSGIEAVMTPREIHDAIAAAMEDGLSQPDHFW